MKKLANTLIWIAGIFILILAIWSVKDFTDNEVKGILQPNVNRSVDENYRSK